MMIFARRKQSERGAALVLALLCLLILSAIGITLALLTGTEGGISANDTYSSKAFYGADSGIEYTAAQLKSSIAFGSTPSSSAQNLSIPINSANLGTLVGGVADKNMQVTISAPSLVGQTSLAGYTFGQWFENDYGIASTAVIPNPSNTQDQASKSIYAQIAVQPVQAY